MVPHKRKKNTTYFVMFLRDALNNTLISQQLRLGNDDGLLGPGPGEILSTLILQFIEPKRINYVYLLILKSSCVHAPK